MDWNRLSGLQQKVLREAIVAAYVGTLQFDMFSGPSLNLKPLAVLVGSNAFEEQIYLLLLRSQAEGWNERLIEALQSDRPDNEVVRNLPTALRAATTAAPARFATSTMQLEKIVKSGGFTNLLEWNRRLSIIGEATCRIEIPAETPIGTGILVSPDLVLTNYHVIESVRDGLAQPQDVVCRFDYAKDTSGSSNGDPVTLAGGADWLVAESPYDRDADFSADLQAKASCLDYALLRLSRAATDIQGVPRQVITLRGADIGVGMGFPVLIVQHPAGDPLKLSIGKSLGSNGGARLRYDADTLGGSSGSGVFNEKLDLIALHHSGDPRWKTKAEYNQGIPIGQIASSLEQKGVRRFWQ